MIVLALAGHDDVGLEQGRLHGVLSFLGSLGGTGFFGGGLGVEAFGCHTDARDFVSDDLDAAVGCVDAALLQGSTTRAALALHLQGTKTFKGMVAGPEVAVSVDDRRDDDDLGRKSSDGARSGVDELEIFLAVLGLEARDKLKEAEAMRTAV